MGTIICTESLGKDAFILFHSQVSHMTYSFRVAHGSCWGCWAW